MFKEALSEVFPLIEKVAPVVAQALGGPYAGTASLVLGLVAKAFGVDKHDVPALVKSILEDPESHAKLLDVQSEIPNEFVEMFRNLLKLPKEAEVNVKLRWD